MVFIHSILHVLYAVCEAVAKCPFTSFNSSSAEFVKQEISDTKCKRKLWVHTHGEMWQTSKYDTLNFTVLTELYIMCTVCVRLASSKHSTFCIQLYHSGSISA